ncbi:hypothetical protein BGW38_007821 [Lunasporangiospora selenospora]|uniref:Methyltransferase domain-containing protein n=1 Tax=Lunasporangiospora selenospora TaxID=979761 RepID=A0A9P6FYZ3_9FUNG|nr:hypothetical protein BGW38_007821 [Lunasporangiospora selenospora]
MSEALDQGALSGGSAEAKAPVDQTRMQLPGHDQFDGHFYGHGHGTLTTNTQSHPLHIRLMPKKEPRVGRLVMSRSKLNSPSVSSLSSAISSSSSRQSASIPGSPMDTDPLESLVASDVPPREAELFGLDSPRRMRPSSTLSSLRSLLGNHPQGLSLAESLDEDVGGEGGDNLDDTDAISDQDSYNSDSLLGERVDAADGDKVSRLARRRRLPPRFEWMTERERLSTATLSTIALDIQDSQKGQHALWKYIGGRNVHAPIDNNIGRILDSGCGLGEWTMDMAALYPNATVYGVDINSELFPSPHQHVPSNCLFTQANILNRLLFPDGYFNFVYQRFLFLGLTVDDWPMVLRELKRVLKPGGWIELFEPRMHVHRAGPRTREVMRWISRLLQEERGLDFDFAGEKMKQLCESDEIGFENVTLERLSIPVGRWGGRVGEAMAENMVLMFQNLQSALLEHEGTQPRDLAAMRAFDAMVQSWIRECEANQSYIDYFILVAQRIS